MLTQWTISDYNELGLAISAPYFLERFDQRRQSVARIESAQEENHRHIGSQRRGSRYVRIDDVGVDAVRNDGPVRLEVVVESDRSRVRHRDRGGEVIEPFLEIASP